jgi:hypothetical protein
MKHRIKHRIKRRIQKASLAVFLLSVPALAAPRALAQDGSIEFVAKATPSGGAEEPVRGFPFYLLSKSFEDIHREAELAYPAPDMDAFIASLDAGSPELKAWMRKNHWVVLSGDEFIHKVKTDDVMNVPEFHQAYIEREVGEKAQGFPRQTYKAADQVKHPDKYNAAVAAYQQAVRRYLDAFPDSKEGIDIDIEAVNPQWKWNDLEVKVKKERNARVVSLAESKYLVARAETDLQGQGFIRKVPPGNYWLSTLDVAATVGDARSEWDLALTVSPGQTAYVALSSANAKQPSP